MGKKIKNIAILFFLIIVLILPYLVFAQDKTAPLNKLEEVGPGSGYAAADEYTMAKISGIVVKGFLSLLGIIFLVLIIIAGYDWMTASGDQEKVAKAKDTLTRAIIGLIITVGAYAIWYFVWINLI